MFMADAFHGEIIYRILLRLPIKSLARFRCVCKLWLKYINDPYLRTIHVQEEPMPIMFQKFSLPQNKIKISFLRGVQHDPVLELCYKPGPFYDNLLLGSCNGLTLVSYEKDHSHRGAYRFALINPFSKQRHNLPPLSLKWNPHDIDLDGPREAVGIGFDDSTNTLKTVFSFHANNRLKVSCTMVISSGTSSWREIPNAYPMNGEGVFGHGRLHWLGSDYIDYVDNGGKIVWFDVKTEEFGLMDPPSIPKGHYDIDHYHLADLNGEVGFAYLGPLLIKIWILKQEEEWVLQCHFDMSLMMPKPYDYLDLEVSGCWNKDGDILFTYNGGEQLFVYTLKTGDLRQVLEESNTRDAGIRMYRSSLFLLNTSDYSITHKSQKKKKKKRVKCYLITKKWQKIMRVKRRRRCE